MGSIVFLIFAFLSVCVSSYAVEGSDFHHHAATVVSLFSAFSAGIFVREI